MEFLQREKPSLAAAYDRIQQSGNPIHIPESEVEQLNTLQLACASRFIYSVLDIAPWAADFLAKYPQYKVRETKVTMGEMGKGPPPKPNMPAGEQLVIYTAKQNFMLAITLYPDQFSITFKTEDYRQLRMIQQDVPIVKAEVYRDGHTIRIIPNGVLREVDYSGEKPNKIGYKDPSIEVLLSSILKNK